MKDSNNSNKKTNVTLWLSTDGTVQKLLLSVALALILLLIYVVVIYGRNTFDQKIFDSLTPYITDSRTRIMRFISFTGKHSFLIPIICLLLVYFFIKKNKWMTIRIVVVVVSSVLLMLLLKSLIHRQRPLNPLVKGITNYAFPSGHAFMSVAFYGLLIWLAALNIRNKWLQRGIITFLIFFILLIGFSRIYLRVHYATDVIAGLCIGFVWLGFCLWFIERRQSAGSRMPPQ